MHRYHLLESNTIIAMQNGKAAIWYNENMRTSLSWLCQRFSYNLQKVIKKSIKKSKFVNESGGINMNLKRLRKVATGIVAILTISACVGCGNNQDTKIGNNGEYPSELTIFSNIGGNLSGAGGTDFNDCMTFQLLEEKTGTHIEWQHPAAAAAAERFNVMIASGNYPDCIVYNWPNVKGGAQSYVDDGIIVDLTDYVEKCMPNFSKLLKENPDFKREVVTDDGKILSIPYIRLDKELCTYQGQVIREDWLEKLNLDVPKNTDELYRVLKAFKTQDPNGNGEADEIPMGGVGLDNQIGIGPLLWSFGTTYGFHLDEEGQVVYGPITDQFQKGLEYIAKLYSEGLIDVDYLLDDRSKYDAKFTNNSVGFGFGYQPSTYYSVMNDGERKVTGIGFIAGPDGKKYCFNPQYTQQVVVAASLAVTTQNKEVEGTLRWLDELYGGEGFMYANFGKEGLSYEMKDGVPTFTEYMTNNNDGKTFAQMVGLTCGVRDSAFPMLQSWNYYKQTLQPWGIEAVENWMADAPITSQNLPTTLSLTVDEGETYAEIMNQVETFMLEECNKVITGKASMTEWQSAVERIKEMGIQDVIDIENAAYSRYKARK